MPPSENEPKREKSRLPGFIGYAVVVFVALIIGLIVIYVRSSA